MTTTSRSARMARWLSIPLGLAISALLIWQASYAAFSDTTATTAEWSTGTLELSHSLVGEGSTTSLFTERNLTPGDRGSRSVDATYTGSLAADVKFYAEDRGTDPALAENILLTITATENSFDGMAGHSGTLFSGKLSDFLATRNSPLNAFTASAVDGSSVQLTFNYEIAAGAPKGATASVEFIGEATSKQK
ncbi:MAG TPA: TasA family protein [Phototrophicaceae bacterium]|nr:TasA family protein [Phototrophicaceae bacterium]